MASKTPRNSGGTKSANGAGGADIERLIPVAGGTRAWVLAPMGAAVNVAVGSDEFFELVATISASPYAKRTGDLAGTIAGKYPAVDGWALAANTLDEAAISA